MSIKIEYIVMNKKGAEVKRFDVKSDAIAYDSIIEASEELSLLIEPLTNKLALTEDQIYGISEHLAFHSEEVKLALKNIKKPRTTAETDVKPEPSTSPASTVKKAVKKKSKKS
jgi:dsDNA-binding SOS-regulon protein